ncbi:C4-dicarboxylate TRAP transporter substrate-binding protein [Pseudooceanicola sp.]|jgi:TRAP-type C4-dicarboxylate transport system substrate-binding protein|uniref:C4-dicarboxylate TRAP transporter substrate-binding protein n=1 Tax=Pseudooceanicola sp. TaxID=1914328 RepID=UPI00405A068C
MKTNSGKIAAAALLAAGTLTAAPALAQNLQYANYLPPTHPSNAFALDPMFSAIEEKSGGSLKITLQAGGALAGAKDTLSAIETGLIDGGFIVSVYVPNEIPLNTMMSDMAMLMEDPVTMVGALNETVLLGCPSCLEEYQGHNVTYLGAYATTPYNLMCKDPVSTLSDIQGLKIRSAGDVYGRWIAEMGGVPVNVANSEAYEAMQRGQLDCVYGSVGWLKSLSLWDVSKHVLRQDMGAFGGGALIAFNSDTWEGLSDEARAMITDEVPAALARLAIGYAEEDEEAIAEASEHGVTVNGKDPELGALLAEYQKSEIESAVAEAEERGAENAQALADTFVANLAKWKKISDEAGGDVAKVEEALRREIYSKLGN